MKNLFVDGSLIEVRSATPCNAASGALAGYVYFDAARQTQTWIINDVAKFPWVPMNAMALCVPADEGVRRPSEAQLNQLCAAAAATIVVPQETHDRIPTSPPSPPTGLVALDGVFRQVEVGPVASLCQNNQIVGAVMAAPHPTQPDHIVETWVLYRTYQPPAEGVPPVIVSTMPSAATYLEMRRFLNLVTQGGQNSADGCGTVLVTWQKPAASMAA